MSEVFNVDSWRRVLSESSREFATSVAGLLPAVIGALAILLVGWLVATIVSAVVRGLLRKTGFNRAAEQLDVDRALRRAGVETSPAEIVARIVWWGLLLTFAASAVDRLGLHVVTTTLDRIVAYLPNVAAAVLILVLGLMLARMVRRVTRSGVALAGIPRASQLGGVAHGAVVLAVCLIALEKLGVDTTVVVYLLIAFLVTLGFTTGLAFALGARPLITHILAGHTLRRSLVTGTSVEVEGRRGMVESVGALETTFRDGERSWTVPNSALLEAVIVR